MHPAEQSAREILATLEATYQPTHRYVPANPADFRHLDLRFYDRTAEQLAGRGFRRLCDMEDRTITEAPHSVMSAILIRSLLSRDGTVFAALYHPHLRSVFLRVLLWVLRKLPAKVTDMETECSDGSFVVTSNAASAALIDDPPLIAAEYLPAGTDPLAVYARHTQRLADHLAARPGTHACVIRTAEDMVASQNRMNAIKAAYRGELGAITREELERLSWLGKGVAGQVHDAITLEQQRRAG
jgi:hypothetical protein